jgi:hypothetical protein
MKARRQSLPLLAVALWLMTGVASVARAAETVGTVAELSGRAEAQHAGESAWAAVAVGSPVLHGDQHRTHDNGQLRIVLREESS